MNKTIRVDRESIPEIKFNILPVQCDFRISLDVLYWAAYEFR